MINEDEGGMKPNYQRNLLSDLQNDIMSKMDHPSAEAEGSDDVEADAEGDNSGNNEGNNSGDNDGEEQEKAEVNNPNSNSSSTERDDGVSSSDSPIESPTPVSEYIESIVHLQTDCMTKQNILKQAVPQHLGAVKLTIVRKKGGFMKMSPKYYLYDENKRAFLMNAKKKVANKTSNYIISIEEGAFNKDITSFIGKVRSNHAKNKYLIYDNGENVDKNSHAKDDQGRLELGYVAYTKGKNSIPGMRELEYIIPNIDEEGTPIKFQPANQTGSLAQKCTLEDTSSMIFLKTQTPYWNEEKQKHMMSFSERVKEASVKNFQLKYKTAEEANADDDILLEFGRSGKESFALTVKYPLSIMNAFSLALSTFDL